MAYQDQFYTVGTVTVVNGSVSVTGAGTGWETALIVGGVFYAGGGAYPIQSVSSETELTLAIPYSGVDAAGLGYAIDRQRAAAISNIAMNDRLAQIIREISIGNIEDLNALELVANQIIRTDVAGNLSQSDITAAALVLLKLSGVPAANQMPYFNGVDGAALTPLTQVGRNLLGATTTAGQRTTVGLARPAFKATTSTNVGLGNGTQVVPFNTVSLNVGNGWGGTIFTAPESGVYAFSVDFNITGGTDNAGNTILSLYKDGGWWQETVRARRTDYFHSVDIASVAYLVAGQTFQPKLALEFWAGTVYAASGRCTISGALIG